MAVVKVQTEQEQLANKVASIKEQAASLSPTSSATTIISMIDELRSNLSLSPSDLAILAQVESDLREEDKKRMLAAKAEIAQFFQNSLENRANDLAESIKDLFKRADEFNKNFENDEKQLDENRKRREANNKIIDENPRSDEAKKARDENIKSLADDCGLIAKNMEKLEKLDSELKEKKEAVNKIFGNTKDEDLTPAMRKLKKEMLEEINSIDKLLDAPRHKLIKHQREITNELAELLIRDRVIEENRDVPADKLKILLKDAIAKGPTHEEYNHANEFFMEQLKTNLSPADRHLRFQKFVDDFASNKGFSNNPAETPKKIESQDHEIGKNAKELWANRVGRNESNPKKNENISR